MRFRNDRKMTFRDYVYYGIAGLALVGVGCLFVVKNNYEGKLNRIELLDESCVQMVQEFKDTKERAGKMEIITRYDKINSEISKLAQRMR